MSFNSHFINFWDMVSFKSKAYYEFDLKNLNSHFLISWWLIFIKYTFFLVAKFQFKENSMIFQTKITQSQKLKKAKASKTKRMWYIIDQLTQLLQNQNKTQIKKIKHLSSRFLMCNNHLLSLNSQKSKRKGYSNLECLLQLYIWKS